MRITYLNKITALALSCLMLFASIPAMAADNPILFEDGVRIKTSDYTVAKGFNGFDISTSPPTQRNGGTAISLHKGLDFNLVPPKAGIYKLELQHKSGSSSTIKIWAGFVENGLKEAIGLERLISGASTNNIDDWDNETTTEGWAWTEMGYAVFPTTAQRTLRLHNDPTVTGSTNGPWSGAIRLTYMEPAQITGSDIQAVVPRGTDSFVIDYSSALDAARADEAVITLADSNGNDIPVNYRAVSEDDDTRLVLALGKTLDYGKEYTLTIDKVADKFGYPLDGMNTTPEQIVFSSSDEAGDEAASSSCAVIDSINLDGNTFTINGTMLGSKGQGIEGRSVTGYVLSPQDGAEPAQLTSVLSSADGKFAITHTVDDDAPGGIYTFNIGGEYVSSPDSDTARYVSTEEKNTILSQLDNAQTALEIGGVIETYSDELGIPELPDYTQIFPAGDSRDSFYLRFANNEFKNTSNEYDIKVFNNVYLTNLALEHMSQADSGTVVAHYIDEPTYTELLDIDTSKYAHLSAKTADFLNEVSLLGAEAFADVIQFKNEFDKLSNKYFLLEKLGYTMVNLASSSASAYQGQVVDISILSAAPFTNVKAIELIVVFGDVLADAFNDFAISSEIGDVSFEVSGNTAICTIDGIDYTRQITSIGQISFTGNNVGTGKVTISGSMQAYTDTELDADINVQSNEYAISVIPQVTQSIGGGSTSGTGGSSSSKGSGGFGGGGSVIVPVDQNSSGPLSTQTVKSYIDLDTVQWAKEAIDGLYNMQVIAMPDDGMFYPDRNITRAEFIKMVVLAKNYVRGSLTKVQFNDVSKDDWFFQYVEAAVNAKLIEGDGSGNFRPNDLITREDICVILSRIMKSVSLDDVEPFDDDSSISEYAKTAVYAMKNAGIVNGIGDNTFEPGSNATRAMAAKIIYGTVK